MEGGKGEKGSGEKGILTKKVVIGRKQRMKGKEGRRLEKKSKKW